jgi:hypothetical protein
MGVRFGVSWTGVTSNILALPYQLSLQQHSTSIGFNLSVVTPTGLRIYWLYPISCHSNSTPHLLALPYQLSLQQHSASIGFTLSVVTPTALRIYSSIIGGSGQRHSGCHSSKKIYNHPTTKIRKKGNLLVTQYFGAFK